MIKVLPFKGDAFAIFKKFSGQEGCFFLDSSLRSKESTHSFIGFAPIKVVAGKDLDGLRAVFAAQQRLQAKAVGYIAYEGGFHFGLYQNWITIDHLKGQLHVHALTSKDLHKTLNILENALVPVIDTRTASIAKSGIKSQPFKPHSNFNKQMYVKVVKEALSAITRGDIYQINLSRMITADIVLDPILLYAALRQHSPSPFTAYYDNGKGQILSSSPERFLKLIGRTVQVKPMKGTRPRGETTMEDERLRQDLVHSAKEIAELLMVTDLERNDLGRVCELGSIKVKAMRTIEAYSSVFQATATIEGRLCKDRDLVDLIKATFPSGSVTGCPKIEAMKFIKSIENVPRGFYTGALGHIDIDGNMDLSVLIRSIMVSSKGLRYHVGGGIVADSNPDIEFAETTLKAQAIERAIREVIGA